MDTSARQLVQLREDFGMPERWRLAVLISATASSLRIATASGLNHAERAAYPPVWFFLRS